MDWVKVETGFPRHPKLERLSDAAKWHYLTLWCYAGEFETDGFIPRTIAQQKGKGRATISLKKAGLLTETFGGFVLVGYLDHNPSKASIQANRARGRERVKRHRNTVTDPERNGVSNAESNATEVEREVLPKGSNASASTNPTTNRSTDTPPPDNNEPIDIRDGWGPNKLDYEAVLRGDAA